MFTVYDPLVEQQNRKDNGVGSGPMGDFLAFIPLRPSSPGLTKTTRRGDFKQLSIDGFDLRDQSTVTLQRLSCIRAR